MIEQVIEIVDRIALPVSGLEWINFVISIIKEVRIPAKQVRHSQIRFCPAVVGRRVYQGGTPIRVSHQIAAPQISMQQNRWLFGDDVLQFMFKGLELDTS